jgi:tetratricopeptide (TPR) repeat protein
MLLYFAPPRSHERGGVLYFGDTLVAMKSFRSISALMVLILCLQARVAGGQTSNEQALQQYAQAGQQALAAGNYPEARQNFEHLAELKPDIAEVHATLAAIYFKMRQYELAVQEVRTAKKLKPSLPKLDSLLGLSLSEIDHYEEALPLLEKGFRQTADSDVRRMCGLQLLRAYTGLGRDSDAVTTALALDKQYPDDPEVLYHTGRIYGNFAFLVMTKLHDKAPGSIWTLQAQGELHESQKEYDEAIFTFNHILELDHRRPGIHYRLGRIYLARFRDSAKPEDREAAQREFAEELTIDPGNGNASYELANIQADLGNLDEAAKLYEQILQRYPDFEESLVGLGGVYLDSHKPQQALTVLEHAARLNPKDDVAWYRISRADRAIGNKGGQQKALATFQELRKAKPLHKPVSDEVTPQQVGPDAPQ